VGAAAASRLETTKTSSTTITSRLREKRRVSEANGAALTTTVPAKRLMSNPTCASVTLSSAAISGSRPVGRNSLVTDVKMRAESMNSPVQGNGRGSDVDSVAAAM
jgi:hypothetical protein